MSHCHGITASSLNDHRPQLLPMKPIDLIRSQLHPSVAAVIDAFAHVPVVASYNPYSRTSPIEHFVRPAAAVSGAARLNAVGKPEELSVHDTFSLKSCHVSFEGKTTEAVPMSPDYIGRLQGLSSDDDSATPPSPPSTPQDGPTRPGSAPLERSDMHPTMCVPLTPHDAASWSSRAGVPLHPTVGDTSLAPCPHGPRSVEPRVCRLYYFVTPTLFPDYSKPSGTTPAEIVFGQACTSKFSHLPRLKLGGICCEIEEVVVAHIIFIATGVIVAGVDMFTNHKGCCSVWLRREADVATLREGMHQRLWTLPCSMGYCLLAKNEDGRRYLNDQIQCITAPFRQLRFPRHLVTVQLYLQWPERPFQGKLLTPLSHATMAKSAAVRNA